MKNCSEKSPAYVLFGKRALSLYAISLQHLLNATNINYKVAVFTDIKTFEKEKEKWIEYTEIDYHIYLKIKDHLKKRPTFLKKVKNKFLLGIFS